MKYTKYLLIMLLTLTAGCSSVLLTPADFSWPLEDVLKVDDNGFITVDRYSFNLNVKPLFQVELNDSTKAVGSEIRLIRGTEGYYYITASGFKNVYTFLPVEGGFKLSSKIEISDSSALKTPKFNQRPPNIELIDGMTKYLLNKNGIVR